MAGGLPGVDVSEYQGYVRWGVVKAAGYHFGIPKATEGLGYRDPYLGHNWVSLAYRRMHRIAYHFLRPALSGSEQADYLHAYVRDCGRFVYGDACMLDLETTDGMDAEAVIHCAEQFVRRAWEQINKPVLLYTGPWFWNSVLGAPHSAILGACPLVQAEYGPSLTPIANWPSGAAFWQHSEHGRVPGVEGECDLDTFVGTERQLRLIMTVVPPH